MAELLKQLHDVVVLKVEVTEAPRSARSTMQVQLTLQGKEDGELRNLLQLQLTSPVIGVESLFDGSRSPQARPELIFQPDQQQALKNAIDDACEPGRPLWVHLVKPYGVLRFIAWEQLLQQQFGVPVLMLPDFIFPRPREASRHLDVALCGSAPLGHEVGSVRDALCITAMGILHGSGRPTRVQVFADHDVAADVRGRLADLVKAGTVIVHDPQDAARFGGDDTTSTLARDGELRSPWLKWMRQALRERAVDVVHFCCHGYLTNGRGAMLFAQSPLERTERFLSTPVGAQELQGFLTQVGAWSSAFESLMDNHSTLGLRGLADEIAQNRPGPMLMHDLREDPSGQALAQAYHFIYADRPEQAVASPAVFLYCQPYLSVEASSIFKSVDVPTGRPPSALPQIARNDSQMRRAEQPAAAAAVDAFFRDSDGVPSWVAATERFADSVQLRYQELARDDLMSESMGQAHASVADDTLARLRSAVTTLAERRGGGS